MPLVDCLTPFFDDASGLSVTPVDSLLFEARLDDVTTHRWF